MGLVNGCYAKIWSARPQGKIYYCSINVSKKDPNTGEYINKFNGEVKFAGSAAEKVKEFGLPEKQDKKNPKYKSVKITRGPDIDNDYCNTNKINSLLSQVPENSELYWFIKRHSYDGQYTIWDIEVDEGSSNNKTPKAKTYNQMLNEDFMKVPESDDCEGLPFDV